jgi:serine/threonine protein kinase
MIDSNPMLKNLVASEATIMKDIKHKNIIHCYEFYETKNNFYLILDYCDKGDLETYLRKLRVKYLKEKEAISVLR